MDMSEAFELNRAEIATGVRVAAERVALPASEPLSLQTTLQTTLQVRDNGTITLRQIASPELTGVVTLTASQAAELMSRIGTGVLKAQARAMRRD